SDLASLTAVDLGVMAVTEAINRAGVTKEDVTHVVMGRVLQAGAGQNPARQVGMRVGLDRTATAETINRVCGSGLRAIALADMQIRLGDDRVIAAGGMERISRPPCGRPTARPGCRMRNGGLVGLMGPGGRWCAIERGHIGNHGGNVCDEEGISREDQDEWAY